MSWRDDQHWLGLLVAIGVALRLAVFRAVAVNGDTGLYLYDAKQVLWGRRLMIDYPSRSPVFEWALAGVIALVEEPLVGARAFMLTISVLVGVAVYFLGREVHSRRAGLVGAAIFLLTPFPVIWGLWVKTEQAAALVVLVGFIVAMRSIDRQRLGIRAPALIGVAFGIAWLIRRVAIVHIGAFCLFVLWYRWREDDDIIGTVRAAVVTVGGAVATAALGYLLVARGDPVLAGRVAWTHGAALFLSSGQGSLGWVGLDSAQAVTAASSGGILAQLCQKCGVNTLEVFHQTALVTAPAMIVVLVGLRSYVREGEDWLAETALPTMLLVLGVYGASIAVMAGDFIRAVVAIGLTVGVAAVWLTAAVEWADLWDRRLGLPVAVLLALSAGYLYRDRILYVTYFQDFYSFLAVVVGAIATEWWRAQERADWTLRVGPDGRRGIVAIAAVVMLVTTGVAGYNAYPYQPGDVPAETEWHSVDKVEAYGDDINRRTIHGERVFTAQPLYVLSSDRHIAANLSRKFYAFQGWPNSSVTDRVARHLARDLESGQVRYAVIDRQADWVLDNRRVRAAFQAHFCQVSRASGKYTATGGTLYRYTTNTTADNCTTYDHTEPDY